VLVLVHLKTDLLFPSKNERNLSLNLSQNIGVCGGEQKGPGGTNRWDKDSGSGDWNKSHFFWHHVLPKYSSQRTWSQKSEEIQNFK
jgi:hypothetical protein